ncbi:hypothetical protein VEJY3_05280 [Vibrio sp. EJY3]|nr:hypothetical protein VEJY3_05280 [Vibrio sp. EJY3]
MKIKIHKLNRLKRDYLHKALQPEWPGMINFNVPLELDENRIPTGTGRVKFYGKPFKLHLAKFKLRQVQADYLTIRAGLEFSYTEYQLVCDTFSASECRVLLHPGIKGSVDVQWLEFEELPKECR